MLEFSQTKRTELYAVIIKQYPISSSLNDFNILKIRAFFCAIIKLIPSLFLEYCPKNFYIVYSSDFNSVVINDHIYLV